MEKRVDPVFKSPEAPHAKRACKQTTPVQFYRPKLFNMHSAVSVSNIPEPFMEQTFKSFIEKQRLKAFVAPELKISVVSLMTFLNDGKVLVEFSSPEIAKEFSIKCPMLKYFKEELAVTYKPYLEETMLDDTLNASQFPVGLTGSTPKARRKLLSEKCSDAVREDDTDALLINDDIDAVQMINDIDAVQMINDIDAVQMMDSKEAETAGDCMGESLDSVSKVQESFINLSPFKVDGINNNTVTRSSKVVFQNVHQPFKEEHFSDFLDLCISKKCPVADLDTSFCISEYLNDTQSVVVKFQSSKVAQLVCKHLQFVEYRLEKWILKADNNEIILEFENVHPPFKENDFVDFLQLCLTKKCEGIDGYDTQFIILGYDQEKQTVHVMFQSSEVADSVCKNLQFVEYRLEKWTVLQRDPCNSKLSHQNKLIDAKAGASASTSSTAKKVVRGSKTQGNAASSSSTAKKMVSGPKTQESCGNEEEGGSYLGPTGVVLSDEEEEGAEEMIELTSEKGKELFHYALLKTRNFFKSKNNHATGLVQMLAYLEPLKVKATVSELAKMRRNLNNCYNVHKRNQNLTWPQYQLCKVIFDGEPVETLSDVIYGDALIALEPGAACKLFTKGAVFTQESRRTLIKILTENAEAYRAGTMFFWSDVEKLMVEEGYEGLDEDACHTEFKELERKFKEVDALRRHTGERALPYITNWPHFREMATFFENDVAVYAPMTIALGSTSSIRKADGNVPTLKKPEALIGLKKPVTVADAGASGSTLGKTGRRLALKKPLSKRDKRDAFMSMIAEQLKRSNDLKERYLEDENP